MQLPSVDMRGEMALRTSAQESRVVNMRVPTVRTMSVAVHRSLPIRRYGNFAKDFQSSIRPLARAAVHVG
jgi:hypothetical protein